MRSRRTAQAAAFFSLAATAKIAYRGDCPRESFTMEVKPPSRESRVREGMDYPLLRKRCFHGIVEAMIDELERKAQDLLGRIKDAAERL
jgi:hypothetical protein